MHKKIIIRLIPVLAILISCQSRYALHFFKVEEQSRQELKSEECYYLENYQVNASSKTMNIAPGRGNLLIAIQSGVNPEQKNLKIDFFTTEGSINYCLYLNLPEKIQKDSLPLNENSICWITGDYEMADSLRMHRYHNGYILIDSVKSSSFFLTLDAKFFNIKGDSLVFSGAMRPKKQKELSRF